MILIYGMRAGGHSNISDVEKPSSCAEGIILSLVRKDGLIPCNTSLK